MQKIYPIVMGLYLVVFAGLTFQQCKVWKNGETLWKHVLKYYPDVNTPWGNLGYYYRDQGRMQEGIEAYNKAIEVKPKAIHYSGRAKIIFEEGQKSKDEALRKSSTVKAIEDYSQAIKLKDDESEFYVNRGTALGSQWKFDLALQDINKGLSLDPENENGYLNRSLVYSYRGEHELALADIQKLITYNPNDPNLYYELGLSYYELKQFDKALTQLNKAIQMNPNKSIYYFKRAQVYKGLVDPVKSNADADKYRALKKQGKWSN